MRLIFVHGWSVTDTDTYGELPAALTAAAARYNLTLNIRHLHLGKYVSFHDEVTVDDIARGLDRALRDLPDNDGAIPEFSCITHSTGGPVVRHWVERYYGASDLRSCPLRHLVMLAPANHGSALAVLGKRRVGRIKSWFAGVEPGQRVLDWLSLGSEGQWTLNQRSLAYDSARRGFFPFVLAGQGIDAKFYDFINSYLVEPGSDGVVRVAGANMNCRFIALTQSRDLVRASPETFALIPMSKSPVRTPKAIPLGVFNRYSHSGKKMGIMRSVKKADARDTQVVSEILQCLQVEDPAAYARRVEALAELTEREQAGTDRFSMLVFNIRDDHGGRFTNDEFDVSLLAGEKYQPQSLPGGFFQDRQINRLTSNLVYYLNSSRMASIQDGCFDVRVVARPTSGFARYAAAEFRSEGMKVERILAPNQTTYVDITLRRLVDKSVFRFDRADQPSGSFRRVKPSGELTDS
jgi:hypothetical protein